MWFGEFYKYFLSKYQKKHMLLMILWKAKNVSTSLISKPKIFSIHEKEKWFIPFFFDIVKHISFQVSKNHKSLCTFITQHRITLESYFFLKSHIRKPLVFLHIYSFVQKRKKDKLTPKIMYFIQKCFNVYVTSSKFSESYPQNLYVIMDYNSKTTLRDCHWFS